MKKLLILAISYNVVMAFSNKANGQAFSMLDTATGVYTNSNIEIVNNITNKTTLPITIKWRVIDTDFPDDWLGAAFSLCDNNSCYTDATGSLWNKTADSGSTQTSNPYIPGKAATFQLGIDLSKATSTGTHYATVELKGNGTSRLATFILLKEPSGITSINNNSANIGIYPNPAQGLLYISYGKNANAKSIVIYNGMGKKIAEYKANNSATTIDLNNYLPGLYFLHLIDDNGNIVGEQKFMHE